MRNLHNILVDKYGIDALYLLREWKRLQVKDSDYRNHHRFTLRCISKGIVPVSNRLKTTVKAANARKIIQKAEKDLLQTRVKSIISFFDNNTKQLDRCRSQLASIVNPTAMEEVQNFINKVGEFRHIKIRDRQISKFNRLVEKQEKREGIEAQTSCDKSTGRALTITLSSDLATQLLQVRSLALTLTLSQGELQAVPITSTQPLQSHAET